MAIAVVLPWQNSCTKIGQTKSIVTITEEMGNPVQRGTVGKLAKYGISLKGENVHPKLHK